ncbi:adenylyl-sulfate kinase [Denitromonas sp.]|uniref:adenylyl-sulfate kinase n=1 Tax=Denitromonas sp. TaxID=2734609 RepID=UPI003A8B528B
MIDANKDAKEKLSKSPAVIWITGYSGAGKTTVGRKVDFFLKEMGVKSIFLDGDDLRGVLGGKWGYEKNDRIELAHSYFRLANLLTSQGVTVVIAAVAMYREVYEWIKTNVDTSLIVHLDVPESERIIRDRATKNIYAELGKMCRLYDSPDFADLSILNFNDCTPQRAATEIIEAIREINLAHRPDKGRQKHWDQYYTTGHLIDEPSSFSQMVIAQIEQRGRLLEIGCGNGRDSFFFSGAGFDVTALDPSEAAITLCRSTKGSATINFFHGTAGELESTQPERFDHVYSRFCFHAMTEEEEIRTLSTAYRLLNSGGDLFIECRSINDPLARKGEVISPTERIHGHYRRFIVPDELKVRLEKSGFELMFIEESDNVAAIAGDNPVVIRVGARRRDTV